MGSELHRDYVLRRGHAARTTVGRKALERNSETRCSLQLRLDPIPRGADGLPRGRVVRARVARREAGELSDRGFDAHRVHAVERASDLRVEHRPAAAGDRCVTGFHRRSSVERQLRDARVLCDVAAGTSGKLYAISGPLSTPVQTLKNVPPPGRYTYYIRGLGSEA